MGSTRPTISLTPIKIYNDSFGTDHGSQVNLSSPLGNVPTLQPGNCSNSNVLAPRSDLNSKVLPPSQSGRSPLKPGPHSSSPPLKHALTNTPKVFFPTPKTGQATDSLLKKISPGDYPHFAPPASHQQTGPVMFPLDKENAFSSDNFAEFPGPEHVSKGLNKRPLPGLSSYDDRISKVARTSAPTPTPAQSSTPARIPEPEEMPAIHDDGKKPRYTYAQLVAMAILRSPQRKLTLSSIYEWISNTFAFYREGTAGGWQNSIRHNLSLHKAFKKVDRPRNNPGKGHYWIIDPEYVADFLDEKASRRPASSSNRPSSRPSSSHGPPLPGPLLAPMQPPPPQQLPAAMSRQAMQPPPVRRASTSAPQTQLASESHQMAEPSSDATIPLSDPALLVEDEDQAWVDISRLSSRARQSSPQPPMHSSPPVPRARSRANTGTAAPAIAELPSSTHGGSKKRKNASMNDSGYYSSLESSAMRRPQSRAGLDSLAPARKRGRAEDEILRIRSSSQDVSPSKGPFLGLPRKAMPGLLSSSPTRPLDQPLTPGAMKFGPPSSKKRKTKPAAPALSPDTQLKNHRSNVSKLIGTPLRGGEDFGAEIFADPRSPQSPSFAHILEEAFGIGNLTPNVRFDFVEDASPLRHRQLAGISPDKQNHPSRPSLLRSSTTPARALGDITKNASNRPSPAASLKPPVRFTSKLGSPLRFASPEKGGLSAIKLELNDPPLTSSPFNKIFGGDRSPMRFLSPSKGVGGSGAGGNGADLLDIFNDDASKFFDFTESAGPLAFDIFGNDENDSPTDGRTPTFGGLDLAGGFDKIGSDVREKENKAPAAKKHKASSGAKPRPGLGGRSATSFM